MQNQPDRATLAVAFIVYQRDCNILFIRIKALIGEAFFFFPFLPSAQPKYQG